ncbi:ubiquitin domain-containing protein DSK2 [Nakaseomyces bracarensis]|uniref:ubiquitin domain-containing protein DSK2 n=1 Tax=Nakaseomyces bracarensis TaxID=273131 RepID=UPI0038712B21
MSINIHVKSGQNKWDVSIEPSKTILELKEEIAKVSEIPAGSQRLIFSGKILKDDQSVESYNIKDDHAVHMVKSGGNTSTTQNSASASSGSNATASTTNNNTTAGTVPTNISSGQTGGFNPLADLTGARYAGYANLPSADMFGPDGGLNNMPDQDEMMRMMENPIFQSQMNEMLSNPEMIDFMIQSNPQLQAMGPQARQMLQSPMFRQMLTNPAMMRQSMQFARMMNGGAGPGAEASAFPAPGGDDSTPTTDSTDNNRTTNDTNPAATNAGANPFAALMNPAMNPFAAAMMGQPPAGAGAGAGVGAGAGAGSTGMPAFDPNLFASLMGGAQPAQEDNRPPEERYEQQLRQLNDMGFFDFDRNVAALRRSGGSVQGALDALLNGDV